MMIELFKCLLTLFVSCVVFVFFAWAIRKVLMQGEGPPRLQVRNSRIPELRLLRLANVLGQMRVTHKHMKGGHKESVILWLFGASAGALPA